MKTKKIQKEFLDYIKNGSKGFEIRKDDDLEGEVELVVYTEHVIIDDKCINCDLKIDPNTVELYKNCIKDSVKVKLKKNDMTAFDIGCIVEREVEYSFEETMWIDIKRFLEEWFKQGDSLYWYDITHIWYKGEWVDYKEYREHKEKK